MVLVKLTDTKTNSTYQLELTTEEFQKAQTDNQFKKQLLANAMSEAQNNSDEASETPTKNEDTEITPSEEQVEENNQGMEVVLDEMSKVLNNTERTEEGENAFRWGREAIYLLLTIYQMKDNEGVFTNGKHSQKACWDMVSREMAKHGHSFSWLQCQNKIISLKKSYRKIKTRGEGKKGWQYYDIMDDIFAGKSFYQPINVASSSDYSRIVVRRQKDANTFASKHHMDQQSKTRTKIVKTDNNALIEILEKHLENLRQQRAERDERREAEKKRLELQRREDRLRFAEERRQDRAKLIQLLEKLCHSK